MTIPRRAAALAVCLLAMAAGAAAVDCNGLAGEWWVRLSDFPGLSDQPNWQALYQP